jgi:hypothetical protein
MIAIGLGAGIWRLLLLKHAEVDRYAPQRGVKWGYESRIIFR